MKRDEPLGYHGTWTLLHEHDVLVIRAYPELLAPDQRVELLATVKNGVCLLLHRGSLDLGQEEQFADKSDGTPNLTHDLL